MYFLCFALIATTILTGYDCQDVDFSEPVSAADYQSILGPGFATNYFKTQIKPSIAHKYNTHNIQDIYDKGFRNVRLRCRPELFNDNYETSAFNGFLQKLVEVVDECIRVGVAPIISWEHHSAEAFATDQDRTNYITWWTKVATELRDKNYHLSYNLFTELGIDFCRNDPRGCDGSLRRDKAKYYDWTRAVINAIRATGGNNAQRIIILGSPEKTSLGLQFIRPDDPNNIIPFDPYMMVEWHEYAAGPSFEPHRPRYWDGEGSDDQKRLLRDGVARANAFTASTGIPTYFGAWMPRDNENGGLEEAEVITFARFFVDLLKTEQIPWSLNVIDNYYRTKQCKWRTDLQNFNIDGGEYINMAHVLENILDVMNG